MKGFRKFLSVMLVCSMLAVPPTQGVTAADYGNGSVEASAEICAAKISKGVLPLTSGLSIAISSTQPPRS